MNDFISLHKNANNCQSKEYLFGQHYMLIFLVN